MMEDAREHKFDKRLLNWCRNLNFYFWKVRFYTNFLL